MKYFFYFFLVVFVASSCSRKALPIEPMNKTYAEFRADQKTFGSADGDIKYVDEGSGEVILLTHGVPTSSWLYRKMIPGLVDQGYRVIAPDMLGFGHSDSPDGYDVYSAENHGKRLHALMSSLGIENWTHVMHDVGGLWSWEMLAQDPSKVNQLVILNTIILEEGFDPPMRMRKGPIAKVSMWSYRVFTKIMLRQLFKMALMEDNISKAELEGYRRPLREKKTKGMYYFFTQTKKKLPDYAPLLNDLDIPSMVIWGSEDEMLRWTPQADEVVKALNIKKEDVHVIDAKHFIQEENHEQVNQLILDFLSKS